MNAKQRDILKIAQRVGPAVCFITRCMEAPGEWEKLLDMEQFFGSITRDLAATFSDAEWQQNDFNWWGVAASWVEVKETIQAGGEPSPQQLCPLVTSLNTFMDLLLEAASGQEPEQEAPAARDCRPPFSACMGPNGLGRPDQSGGGWIVRPYHRIN
jgi:hypothetical protein